jgi:ribosomal protein L32E
MSNDTPNFRGHFPLTTRRRKSRRDVTKWRRPQGIDSSIAQKRGPIPKIGYGHKNSVKNLHPCGLAEKLIISKKDLIEIKETNVAIRFSAKLGAKSKIELRKIAAEKNLKVLN